MWECNLGDLEQEQSSTRMSSWKNSKSTPKQNHAWTFHCASSLPCPLSSLFLKLMYSKWSRQMGHMQEGKNVLYSPNKLARWRNLCHHLVFCAKKWSITWKNIPPIELQNNIYYMHMASILGWICSTFHLHWPIKQIWDIFPPKP